MQMRAIILIISLLVIIQSCSKLPELENDPQELNNKYFFDFDIIKINYTDPDQDLQFVTSEQENDFVTFRDVNMIDRYLYLGKVPSTNQDSVTLLGSVTFKNSEESTFNEDNFKLEFFFTEDKSNLIALSDSTYRFKTNRSLFIKLRDEGWGHQQLFGNGYVNQLLLTFPELSDTTHTWGLQTLSSNGFYFENEQLEITSVDYDEEKNSIELGGLFNVFIKELSCGFYDFYHVSNAEFLIEIK